MKELKAERKYNIIHLSIIYDPLNTLTYLDFSNKNDS